MIKGKAYINRQFKYQIHATDRIHDEFGIVVVNAEIDEFDSNVTIYDSGKIIIESPNRKVQINIKDGTLLCE